LAAYFFFSTTPETHRKNDIAPTRKLKEIRYDVIGAREALVKRKGEEISDMSM
jgi:phosphopantetheinyl transferase